MIAKCIKQIAKENTSIVWEYLVTHPEIHSKTQLPYELFKLVRLELCHCPLCTLYNQEADRCAGCPLSANGIPCKKAGSPWLVWSGNEGEPSIWRTDYRISDRQEAAMKILAAVDNWDIDEI